MYMPFNTIIDSCVEFSLTSKLNSFKKEKEKTIRNYKQYKL